MKTLRAEIDMLSMDSPELDFSLAEKAACSAMAAVASATP